MPSPERLSLFLDLDGTLLELADRPDEVIADDFLRELLAALSERLGKRLAIISGRSIAQIEQIIGPVAGRLALAGSHGSELRWDSIDAHPVRPPELDVVAEQLRAFAAGHEGVLVEDKSFGAALHFRQAPGYEPAALYLAGKLAKQFGLEVQHGKLMVELRPVGGNKGKAVHNLMARPAMRGTTPFVLGDDETDEAAFLAALELGGVGIIVGARRPTHATFALPSPSSVRDWLRGMIA